MASGKTYGWLEVERIGEELTDAYPEMSRDEVLKIKFVDLRRMVEKLPGFSEEAGHPVNEKILEAIQMAWLGERGEDD